MSSCSQALGRLPRKLCLIATLTLLALLATSFCARSAAAEQVPSRPRDLDERTIRKLGVDPRVASLYEVIPFHYTGGMFVDEPIDCGLIKPAKVVPGERYPMIVWMAGIGPEELDEEAAIGHLRWLEQILDVGDWSSQKRPCFVLVMKVKAKKGRWFDRHADPPRANSRDLGDEQVTVLYELLKTVLPAHSIDRERVCLMGVSAGGTACFEMAMRYPELFAAMVPMASAGADVPRVQRLADIPVWAFHGTGDQPANIRATIAALQHAGGNAHLTEIEGDNHNCWTPATKRYDIFAWLFAQRRGRSSYPPGVAPLPWWNYGALAAIASIFVVVWKMEQRRRRHAKAADIKVLEYLVTRGGGEPTSLA
jgi:predicted esterase